MHMGLPRILKVNAAIAVVLTASLMLGGCSSVQTLSQKPQNSAGSKYDIATAQVKKGDISIFIEGVGSYKPAKTTSLFYTDISGPLKRVFVKQGDEVKAGQQVMEIDPKTVKELVEDRELSMERWKIRKQQLEEAITLSQKSLYLARIDLEEARKVYNEKSNEKNKRDLEQQKLRYEQASSELKNAKWNKEISELEYKQDKKDLESLKAKVADSKLKSPVSGIAVFVDSVSESEMIAPNRVLARVAQQENFVLEIVSSDAKLVNGVKNATLSMDNEEYDVSIYTPQPGDKLEDGYSNVKAENKCYVTFKDKMPKVQLDEVVNVRLGVKKDNVLTLSKAAIYEDGGKTKADILLEDKTIRTAEVVCGLSNDTIVEIISGLEEGNIVALR